LEDINQDKVYTTLYNAFISNQDLQTVEIWEQYKKLGDEENRIKEIKEYFGLQ